MAPDQERAGLAGLLLTGGRSRRMGFDKSTLTVEGVANCERLASLLSSVVGAAVEVGPGRSSLPAVLETDRGSGPLAALVAGTEALRRRGHHGPVVVVACDLPLLSAPALRMIARWPAEASVVPVVEGMPQPLCARWSVAGLAEAARLLASGERSMRRLLGGPGVVLLGEERWPAGVEARMLADVDSPADLARLGLRFGVAGKSDRDAAAAQA